jgi:hypothetical protein
MCHVPRGGGFSISTATVPPPAFPRNAVVEQRCVAGSGAIGGNASGPGHPELRICGLFRSMTRSLSSEGLMKKRELPLNYVVLPTPTMRGASNSGPLLCR